MDEAVDGGERHCGIWEDLLPCAEGLVGGDQHRAPLVAGADEFEEHAGFGLILGDVGEIVEDEQMELIELGERALEGEFTAGDLQLLDEIGGSGEEHPVAVLDQGETDCRRQVALSAAGRAEQQQICAFLQPAVAGGDRHDLGLGDHRHGVELECVERLSRKETSLGEVPFHAATVALGQFVLGKGSQETGGRPAFLVGLFGELRPDDLAGGQTQLVEKQTEPRGVDDVLLHAASPVRLEPIRAS